MTNPLVAAREDSTKGYTGIGLVESAADIYNGVQNGSWVEGGLGALGGGLEVLSLALDPIGTLGQYAISWVIEHVAPLRDALNWLAGDADQIAAYAATWKNVSQAVGGIATDFGTEVANGTSAWTGPAADAYRANTAAQGEHITAAATGAGTIGTVVEVVGALVGVVRGIVRDLVAECISTLLLRLPQWLAEAGLTLGLATPHIVASVGALVAKWVGRITDVITKLIRSVEKLRPILAKLGEIWEAIKSGLRGLRTKPHGADTPSAPDAVRNAPAPVDAPSTTGQPNLTTPNTPNSPSTSTAPSGSSTPTTTTSSAPPTPSTTTAPSGTSSPSTTPSSVTPTVTPSSSTVPSGSVSPSTTPSSVTPTVTPSSSTVPSSSSTPPTSSTTGGGGGGTPPVKPTTPGSSGPHWTDTVRGKFTDAEWKDFKGAMDKLGADPKPGDVPGSGQLTPHERDLMARAMKEVEVTNGTLMQKVIPDADVANYLNGKYTEVGGFVARHQDAGGLNTPADLINGNRLDYSGTPYDVSQPTIHTIEFPASDASLYRTPIGAPSMDPSVPGGLGATDPRVLAARDDMINAVENAGVNPDRYSPSINQWPYTGAGVTAHPTMGVPEFQMGSRMPIPDGSTINQFDAAGNKTVVAVYDSVLGWVRQ
ncbi:WXG100 family type VII secretion target [Actinokineospora globicatena]|uniref:Uncharacterized protein n=1 Tax=Actinokineospora globicatena TaxID=103729 RepID=A0A9W6QLG6_9PSEU|nr:hypothetical protein [Actinokineospora globicatena]GLW92216.1 hypothetical protein Aglo03_30320 [Actinokineospora globicatena]